MNALLLRNLGGLRRSSSLQSFAEYRQAEQRAEMSSVTSEGTLLEYETLELRIHPPNVVIDNETYDDLTVITIDSANRPGTLIEVVQCLTELGLSIRCARISSDGGWFVDEFFVTETPKGKLLDQRKMNIIRKVLSVETDSSGNFRDKEICTVFELAGRDRHGLLAAVLQLLVVNGCEVLSAAVWTFHDRVALVISATERGAPVVDPVKLDRLEQILYDMLGGGDAVVNSELVRGEVHHERRLHHLLLLEELKAWELQYMAASTTPTHNSSQYSTQNGVCAGPPSAGATDTGILAAAAAVAAASAPAAAPPGRGPGEAVVSSAVPSRSPSPAPPAALQAENSSGNVGAAAGGGGGGGSGGGGGLQGFTSAGFPQADEGGAACPQAAAVSSGSGPAGSMLAATVGANGGFESRHDGAGCAAAPAGPYDAQLAGGGAPPFLGNGSGGCGPMGRCASTDGPLPGGHVVSVSEPLIDVGLDLPAVLQLQDQAAAAALDHRRRSTAGPADATLAAAGSGAPLSPSSATGPTAAADSAASAILRHSTSSNSLQLPAAAASGGGVAPPPPGLPPLPPRSTSNRTMTVTGDEHETGQPSLAPAPTAAPPSLGGAAGEAHDQLAQLRRSEVRIQHSALLNYWLVTIRCRDRNKLFFDTVCTLADMNYDIYHATIDSEGDAASQLFYVRPRYGECVWDERRAAKLRYMLESAVQRRFPRGTKVCVQSNDRSALVNLFSALSSGGFWITRADVRAHHEAAVFEFTITDTRGQLPEQSHVQRICEAVGGIMASDVYGPSSGPHAGPTSRLAGSSGRGGPGGGSVPPGGAGTFRFSILERRWNKGWGGGNQSGAAGSFESGASGSM